MSLSRDILEEFHQITGFDIVNYYSDVVNFTEIDYPYMVEYFNGKTDVINASSFEILRDLLRGKDDLFSLFTHSKNRLQNLKWFDLMIEIEEIDTVLMTADNISKWLRSPKTNTSYNQKIEVNIGLKQANTLERVSKEILREEDYQNDWVKTAIRNNLTEESYSEEGGNLLAVTFSSSGQLFIAAVVDNINSDNILGLDIDQYTQFVDNDLKVLSYKETYKQSIRILSSLKVGDNPYLADDGIITSQVVGSNINLLNLPSLFRQLASLFATDDTIKSFVIKEVTRKADALFVIFVVTSVMGDTAEFKQQLSN